jgi:hypothetical protein
MKLPDDLAGRSGSAGFASRWHGTASNSHFFAVAKATV